MSNSIQKQIKILLAQHYNIIGPAPHDNNNARESTLSVELSLTMKNMVVAEMYVKVKVQGYSLISNQPNLYFNSPGHWTCSFMCHFNSTESIQSCSHIGASQKTQNICMRFVHCWTNVEQVNMVLKKDRQWCLDRINIENPRRMNGLFSLRDAGSLSKIIYFIIYPKSSPRI